MRDERIEFVVRASLGEASLSGLCREFGVSRPTGYRWLSRYKSAGSALALSEHSRRPHQSPGRTPPALEARVVALRRQFGWGARKLRVLLLREGIDLPVITIHRILLRHGLVDPSLSVSPATRRFEREAPNELWQMDHKGEMRIAEGWCYPLSIVDDHSRYVVGLYATLGPTGEPVQRHLIHAFERQGMPEAILVDHGTPWWSTTNGHGLTWVSVWLLNLGVRVLYSGIGHPQTQGKVERFHRTLKAAARHAGLPATLTEWKRWLAGFRTVYNEQRPHEALGQATPASRYRPSPRTYNPRPAAWEYPVGAVVRRLNTQGCLEWDRRRYFVCEALAGQPVAIETLDQLILVRYRDIYVREINPKNKTTKALMRKERQTQV